MQNVVEVPSSDLSENSTPESGEPENKTQGWPARNKKLLIALLVLAAIAISTPYILHSLAYESTDDAFVEAHIVEVSPKIAEHVARVLVEDNQRVAAGDVLVELDNRDYTAKLEQAKAALAAAQASAQQSEANVGLTAKMAGAGLDWATSGLDLAKTGVSTAQAAAGQAQSGIAQADAATASARAAVANAQAAEASAQAEADRAQADLQRYTGLPEGAVAKQQVDVIRAASKTTEAHLLAAKDGVRAAQSKVGEAEAAAKAARQWAEAQRTQIGQAEARVGQATGLLHGTDVTQEKIAQAKAELASAQATVMQKQAELDQAKLLVGYTQITAPRAGRITGKSVEAGAYVQAGQPLLAIVPDDFWVVANFKETQLARMHAGEPAEIKIDALGGRTFKAHVDSLQAGTGSRFSLLPPENATGNFVKVVQRVPVKLVFDESPQTLTALAPGMSAEPEVKVK